MYGLQARQIRRRRLDDALGAQERGDIFHAYDLATELLEEHPDHLGLQYHVVLSLARMGLTAKAQDKLEQWGLQDTRDTELAALAGRLAEFRATLLQKGQRDQDKHAPKMGLASQLFVRAFEDVAALPARLQKDLAWAAGYPEDRQRHAEDAVAAYAKVFEETGGFYSGFNLASMHLLADDPNNAGAIARSVLSQLEERPIIEAERFVLASAKSQCYLLTGEYDRIDDDLLEDLASNQPKNLIEASTVWRQLDQTVRELKRHMADKDNRSVVITFNKALERLNRIQRPSVVHFCGRMISAPFDEVGLFLAGEQEEEVSRLVKEAMKEHNVGAGFGALACGADILFAEALLDAGSELHVVLPFDKERFIETSVRRGGTDWITRFHNCMDAATSVNDATTTAYLGDEMLFGHGSRVAMGMAILCAKMYRLPKLQLAVTQDRKGKKGTAGTAANMWDWQRRKDRRTEVIPIAGGQASQDSVAPHAHGTGRKVKAILFGDLKGFSKMGEDRFVLYRDILLKTIADLIEEFDPAFYKKTKPNDKIEFCNTWGDAVYVIVNSATNAAEFSLRLQEQLKLMESELIAAGLPKEMKLRLGGHLGPVFHGLDPILKTHNWSGSEVSRAARMEPVTPPGEVYVTEPFAAVLALEDHDDKFFCAYDGNIPSAKGYGRFRMYKLQRLTSKKGVTDKHAPTATPLDSDPTFMR